VEAEGKDFPVWRFAELYGARCFSSLEESVTHVIAKEMGTAKVNMFSSPFLCA
jgi:hypothetical protein